jgi:Fe-S-cluster containining protein
VKYFSTPHVKRIELRLSALLVKELEFLPQKIDASNIKELLPRIMEFTASVHDLYSKYTAEVLKQSKSPVCCKGKCSNCCHHYPMSVEPFELISLYSFLRNNKGFAQTMESLWQRVKAYSKLKDLKEYFSLSLPCPFLAPGGNCGIYQQRPITCRMYFSITKSEFCVPLHLQSSKNKNFIVYLPDSHENLLASISERYAELELSEALYAGLLEMNVFEKIF